MAMMYLKSVPGYVEILVAPFTFDYGVAMFKKQNKALSWAAIWGISIVAGTAAALTLPSLVLALLKD